ncbi:3-oxoacyl-ACP reductase [Aphelenchoides fujianensis]|nr:3-oxoacyl-ACP reductase [Aphelenchoides fujianensis]
MRSIVWRLAPLIAVLAVLFEQTNAAEPYLFNVRQLTKTGIHSFPQLSADGRYVYFSAKSGTNGGYGSKACDDVYKLDLAYWNETRANWKISRVSPGVGHASRVSAPPTAAGTVMYESTFHKLYDNLNADPAATGNGWWCPASPCSGAAARTVLACAAGVPRIEFYDGTTLYATDAFGQVVQQTIPAPATGSYYSCPRRGLNSLVHTRPFSSDIDATHRVKGAYPYIGNDGFIKGGDVDTTGYFDGVNYGTSGGTTPTYTAFFHGVPDAGHDPAAATDNQYSLNVFDPTNTKIYQVAVDADGKRLTGAAASASVRYFETGGTSGLDLALYPQSYQSGANIIFSGRTNTAPVQEVIYTTVVPAGGVRAAVAMSDSAFNSKQASLAPNGNQLVFVRQPSAGSDYQLYIADLVNNFAQPTFTTNPYSPITNLKTDNLELKKVVQLPGVVGQVRAMETTGDLIFEYNVHPSGSPQCKQVYHVDTTLNDFSTPRLLSSGLGTVDGLSFYEDLSSTSIGTNVIYASDFIKGAPTDQNKAHNCDLDPCNSSPDTTLDAFCKANVNAYKWLNPNHEIYQADIFGSFVKRHTTRDGYDGQPAVSPDQTQLVFTRASDDRVDLILRKAFNSASPTDILLTEKLPTGYYDRASWSADGQYVAFHGYEVDDANVLDFRRMLGYNVVSTKQTDIFVVSVRDLQPTKVSKAAGTTSSFANPAFSSDYTIVYDGTVDGKTAVYEYNIVNDKQTAIYDNNDLGFGQPAFAPKSPNTLTFSEVDSDGKTPASYESAIYVAQYTATGTPRSSTTTPYVPTTSVSKPADSSSSTAKPGSTTKGIGHAAPTAFGLLATSLLLVFGRHPGIIEDTKILKSSDVPEAQAAAHLYYRFIADYVTPFKRAGLSKDVAAVVLFLASDKASYVTGSNYHVDGGATASLPSIDPREFPLHLVPTELLEKTIADRKAEQP